MANVKTVAIAATAANTIAMVRGLVKWLIKVSSMTRKSRREAHKYQDILQVYRFRSADRTERRGCRTSCISSLEVEVDHLAHDKDTHCHPKEGDYQHESASGMRPKQLNILRARQIYEESDDNPQRSNDGARSLCFHWH